MTPPGLWTLTSRAGGYPARLRELDEHPTPMLHGAGRRAAVVELDRAATATIVGSRSASAYGLRVAEALARELAIAGVTVISGMARGIDAAAHRGALAGRGRTIAVLANGPDVVYPRMHGRLYEQIVAAGAVVSEYPPGTPPQKRFFPDRNRIMAALGQIVIIVEAALPSGSMITADRALELGRTVGAVPGQVGARNAGGTNALIKDGAQLIRDAQDVLDLLFEVGHRGRARPVELEPPLDRVLELVAAGGSSLDRLAQAGGLPAHEVAVALSRLELLGVVERDALGAYTPTGIGGP